MEGIKKINITKLLGMEVSPAFWHSLRRRSSILLKYPILKKTISLSEILGSHDTFVCARDQVSHPYKINRQNYSIRILISTFFW